VVREKGNNLLLRNEVMQRIRPSRWPMHVGAAGETRGGCNTPFLQQYNSVKLVVH
jgi:hypothetical protein